MIIAINNTYLLLLTTAAGAVNTFRAGARGR